MPSLKANDGIALHYETYGSGAAIPLVLVSANPGPTISCDKA
jgi:hypothetical protein